MSDPDSKSLSPGLAAGVLFFINFLGLGALGVSGVLATLPQGVQFLFGLEVVAFPLIVYMIMKRRQDRGQ